MNVEIGAEAALFPEKEYIYGILVAVQVVRATAQPRRTTFRTWESIATLEI